MSPSRVRQAVVHVQETHSVSASGLPGAGSASSTQRYGRKLKDDEPRLVKRIHELVQKASALWISSRVGVTGVRGLACECPTDRTSVASGGPESTEEATEKAASGFVRERVPPAAFRTDE